MKHKHNATDLFPTWYKTIDPLVNAAVVVNRVAAIEKLLDIVDQPFWLDVVRLALGRPAIDPKTLTTLDTEFKEADVNFPLESNGNLIKVLSGILLCFLFESENAQAGKVAMAVNNAIFFEQFEKSGIPYYDYAGDVLADRAVIPVTDTSAEDEVLTAALGALEEDPAATTELDNADHIAIIRSIQALQVQNSKLKEETNVMWWLFGQYSFLNKTYFPELGLAKMVLTAAQELSELSQNRSSLSSARHLLYKALEISNDHKKPTGNVSVAEAINSVSADVKSRIMASVSGANELTPCLYALSLSVEFKEETVWKPAFKGKVPGADADKAFEPIEIAFQFYNEIMFLKTT